VPQRFPRWDQVKSSLLAVVVAVPNSVPVVMGQPPAYRRAEMLHPAIVEPGLVVTAMAAEGPEVVIHSRVGVLGLTVAAAEKAGHSARVVVAPVEVAGHPAATAQP
jgi:hypothetical protein